MKKVLFALTFIAATSMVAMAQDANKETKKTPAAKEAHCAEGKKSCCSSKEGTDKKAAVTPAPSKSTTASTTTKAAPAAKPKK